MTETFFTESRIELVKNLRQKGIKSEAVLEAFLKVHRHKFIESGLEKRAYEDVALPIGNKQTISQPYTVAFMSQELNVGKNAKVLEIGTGSGFQAAILYTMGIQVFSIERHQELLDKSRKILEENGFRVAVRCGDGTLGWSQFAPYDGIICTAGSPSVPQSLLKQLKVGARLIIPVGDEHNQVMQIITRTGEDTYSKSEADGFKFVPLIGKEGWKK